MQNNDKSFLQTIGPGILFAGAAIGTSHLVQSTRAGAIYGLGFLVVIVVTHILKYPSYRFGPVYAAATGRSLVEGYADFGKWVVVVYALSELAVSSIIIAATAITTAAMLLGLFDSNMEARYVGTALVAFAMILLGTGGFQLLDRLTKVFVAILTACTVVSTMLVLKKIEWSLNAFSFPPMDAPNFSFLIALMGFMPAGMSLSVLHSLWTVAKSKQQHVKITPRQAVLDFNIGYFGSAVLAICFLLMGAGVMNTAGIAPASGAAPFAKQVIGLYTSNLGEWSGVVVGVCAVSVMFTTLLTIMDGFPRVQAASWYCALSGKGVPHRRLEKTALHWVMMTLLSAIGVLIMFRFMSGFRSFIDFVTISAFIVGPFTALLNHLVMNRPNVPAEHRPSRIMNLWSILAIVLLAVLAVVYLVQRF